MPFSRENVKFTVLTIGFVLLCIVGVAGVVAIATSSTSASSTPLTTAVIAFVSIQAGQLLIMLRTEQAHQEIVKTRHDIKEPLQPIVSNAEHVADVAERVEQKVETVEKKLNGGHDDELLSKLKPMIEQIVEEAWKRHEQPPPK